VRGRREPGIFICFRKASKYSLNGYTGYPCFESEAKADRTDNRQGSRIFENRKLFCLFILFYKRFDKIHECLHGLVVILQDAVQTVYIKSGVLMDEDIPEPGKS